MKNSLRFYILAMVVVFFFAIGAVTLLLASTIFKSEIDSLYREDFSGRIRNMEWEYGEVDATSHASSEVWRLQNELLQELEERYVEEHDFQPFIMNGEGEVVLHVSDSLLPESELQTGVGAVLEQGEMRELQYELAGRSLWILYSYYEPWDWYTGYVVPERARMEALRSFQTIAGFAVVAMTLLALLFFTLYLRRALRPVGRISEKLETTASGRPSGSLEERGASELRAVAKSLNDLLRSLRENVGELQRSAEANREVEQTLSATTEENGRAIASISELVRGIETDIHSLNRKVTDSQESLNRIVETLEGFESEVKEQGNALDSASGALERIVTHSESVASTTERHRKTTEALIESMSSGREEMEETRRTVEEIQSSTGAISDFLELMKSIAEQTNLLSMNAAIEAAHAGEAGSGFAVVADEIRKLAQQAGQQSQEVGEVIATILDRIERATQASRKTAASFQRADEEMGQMRSSFAEVSTETEELLKEGERISSEIESLKSASEAVHRGSTEASTEGRGVRDGLKEVAALSEQVEQRIGEIGGATTESNASMEELRRATEALTETAASLAQASERWKIEE